jgi:hypothetical protein
VALIRFSPLLPVTNQRSALPVSPIDQPARCRRAKDSSGDG